MYDDQVRLKKKSDLKNERESSKLKGAEKQKREKENEKRNDVLISEERKKGKQVNLYAKESDTRNALFVK